MNSIVEFFWSIGSLGERKEVVSLLSQLQDEINTSTLPVLTDAVADFSGVKYKSKFAIQLQTAIFSKGFQGDKSLGAIAVIQQAIIKLNGNIDFLEREVKRLFALQFSREGLTYKRIALLKYIESTMFFTQYARKATLRIIAEESIALGKATPIDWAKVELEWLDKYMSSFASLMSAISVDEQDLKQAFAQTSDAVFEEATVDIAVNSLGNRAVNPLRIHNIAPNDNWLFSIGKAIAELKVKRFQAAKAEHQSLQLRLQEYREIAKTGNVDPKLQKLIKITEGRIEDLDYQINKITQENKY